MTDISAIILIGPLDFGRCSLASSISPSMWPMLDVPALKHTVNQLHQQGLSKVTICAKDHTPDIENCLNDIKNADIKVIYDLLPDGTAGTLRNAAKSFDEQLLLVLPATVTILPEIKPLVDKHLESESDLSVIFNPDSSSGKEPQNCAEIYICSTKILEYIPSAGYRDLKEHLVPQMVRDGKKVMPIVLDDSVGGFRNVPAYLKATAKYLKSDYLKNNHPDLEVSEKYGENVYIANDVEIDESVRIFGPCVIFPGVNIEKNTLISGPVVIGKHSWVGQNSILSDCILWPGSGVGANSQLKNCVLSYDTKVLSNSKIENSCVTPNKKTPKNRDIDTKNAGKVFKSDKKKMLTKSGIALLAVCFALLWSYWETFSDLFRIWTTSDEYSAGVLVPILAGYVVWANRRELFNISIRPAVLGVFALIFIQLIRLFGLYFDYSSIERMAFVMNIFALVLLCLGWRLFFKLLPVLFFLFLMIPLPNRFNNTFSLQLQEWATKSAVWTLEVLGYLIRREGNIIHIGDTSVAVAEACNGLRMITAFFVIAGWFALLVHRKWWEKIIVFVSALPISLLCNTIRLTITSIAFTMIDADYWAGIFHDYGGYAMMPIAIGLIIFELWLLKNLFINDDIKVSTEKVQEQVIVRKK